jgi:hypothetical protein
MRRQVFRALALLLVIAPAILMAGTSHSAHAFVDDPSLGPSYRYGQYVSTPIRTAGDAVVWIGTMRIDNGDVVPALLGASLTEREPFELGRLHAVYPQFTRFDVDDDLAVWSGYELGPQQQLDAASIIARPLSGGDAFVVADFPAPGIETLADGPVVSGDWVVWISANDTTRWVKARNITTMAEPITLAERLAEDGGAAAVQVDDGWVVWGETYDRERNAFLRHAALRIGSDDPVRIIDTGDIAHFSTVSLADGMLVYPQQATQQPTDPTRAIAPQRIIQLASGQDRVITIAASDAEASPSLHPISATAFDGRYIFQTFMINIITPSNGSLELVMAYDTLTGATFPVVRDMLRSLIHAEDGTLAWIATGDTAMAAKIADRLPTAPRPDGRAPHFVDYWFPETGHHLGGIFKSFWEAYGSFSTFGFPLTEEYVETNADTGDALTVQWFERQRYEWHPENAGTPYEVLLGRLGVELLAAQGRDWTTFPKADPAAPGYVPETGQAVASEFASYWSSHGLDFGDSGTSYRESLALFGYPISPPMIETNADGDTVLTQYFERAVFEYHPDNAGTAYEVLLRRVGAELLAERGWVDE